MRCTHIILAVRLRAERCRAVTALQRDHEDRLLAPDASSSRNDARILGGSDCVAGTGRVPTVAVSTASRPATSPRPSRVTVSWLSRGFLCGAYHWRDGCDPDRRSASELCSLYT